MRQQSCEMWSGCKITQVEYQHEKCQANHIQPIKGRWEGLKYKVIQPSRLSNQEVLTRMSLNCTVWYPD